MTVMTVMAVFCVLIFHETMAFGVFFKVCSTVYAVTVRLPSGLAS
jgi:hypothetical protein